MMRSMTGFSHRDFSFEGVSGCMELKSYNNRYLDLYLSLPQQFSRFEPHLRRYLGERMNRGKVELTLKVRRFERPVSVYADLGAAQAVADTLRRISQACGLGEEPKLSQVASFEGVLSFEKEFDEDLLWQLLEKELGVCFAEFDESRLREGAATATDLYKELSRVEAGLAEVLRSVPEIEKNLRSQFETRFAELVPQIRDENRILSEVAVLLVKFGINEETARLGAHLAAFRDIADREEAPAKKLDFLCQEMNREVNTIGSKNMLIPIARAVVEMKDALENLREQLRNVE